MKQSSFEYLVKRDVDVFHSGRLLPLVTGRGYFRSRASFQNMHKMQIPFGMMRPFGQKSMISTPQTEYSVNGGSPLGLNDWKKSGCQMQPRPIPFFNYGNPHFKNQKAQYYRKSEFLGGNKPPIFPPIQRKIKNEANRCINGQLSGKKQEPTLKSKGIKKIKIGVFINEQKVRDLIPPLTKIKIKKTKKIELNSKRSLPGLKKFRKVAHLLCKFLLGENISIIQIKKLSKLEKTLFMLYVNKKKSLEHQIDSLTEDTVASLHLNWNKKRTNKNLRYVVNKILKLMKDHFKLDLYPKTRPLLKPSLSNLNQKATLDYCFYGYYFLDAINYLEKRIECYFHPNSKRNPVFVDNPFIPNHISETYLNNLRTSKLFVRDFVLFLKGNFRQEARTQAINSILKSAKGWEKVFKDDGEAELMKKVRNRFIDNPKGKFPWGLQEVDDGVHNILFKLGHI